MNGISSSGDEAGTTATTTVQAAAEGSHDFDAPLTDDDGPVLRVKSTDSQRPDTVELLKNTRRRCCGSIRDFGAAFMVNVREMRNSPRDLVVLYSIAFLDALAYYVFSYALMMHLGREVGLSDEKSGLFYGIFGVCISISTLVTGFLMDSIGIRWAICLSAALGLVSRLAMAYANLANSVRFTAVILFVAVSPSMALMGPAIPVAFKRFTTAKTRTFAFSIYYGVMNVAGFLATPAVDVIRIHNPGNGEVLLLPPYAMLIAATALIQIPIFFAAAFGIRDMKLEESEDGTTAHMVPMTPLVPIDGNDEGKSGVKGFLNRIRGMTRDRNFLRAIMIAVSLIGVKSSFRYFDALYLPYVTRAYSDADTFPYLTLLSLNPIIVIPMTLTGLVTMFTNRAHPVKSLIIGSFIGGIAPAFMAIGPFIISILLYVIATSIGEIIWSPVTYSYLMEMPDEGAEGAWMALAGLPMFAAKILTGGLTGGLMGAFCPDPNLANVTSGPRLQQQLVFDVPARVMHELMSKREGTATFRPTEAQIGGDPHTCWSLAIWGIIALTTSTSFVSLLVFRKFITIDTNLFYANGKPRNASADGDGVLVPMDHLTLDDEDDVDANALTVDNERPDAGEYDPDADIKNIEL